MQRLFTFIEAHQESIAWVSGASALMFVGSLLLVPWLVARAPEDVFVRQGKPQRTGLAMLGMVLRNLAGAVLLVMGILMLILPGQGLLTLVVALLLLDLPGKRRLVRRIVRRKSIWRGLAYLRKRAKKPPFERP